MATTPILGVLAQPRRSLAHYPGRVFAGVVVLVALTAGWFAALHLLGTFNILLGYPAITARAVILTSLAGILGAGYLLSLTGLSAEPTNTHSQESRIPRAVKVVVALAAIPYIAFLLDTLCSFPNGTDSLGYHINAALKWLQQGTMRVDLSLGWKYALPSNAELPALLALSLGAEKAVAIGNIFASILLAMSVYLIAWKLTPRIAPCMLSTVVASTIPIVVFQTFELYVDLFGAAFLVGAVALLIWREKSPLLCTFLSGCAAGVAIGSKPVFLVYAGIYAFTGLLAIWRSDRRRLLCVALLLSGMMLTCTFWFLRVTLATGNPLYPIRIPIFRQQKQAGYAPTSIMQVSSPTYRLQALLEVLTYPWTEVPHNEGLPIGPDRGTGALFPAIAVPGVFFLLLQTWRRRVVSTESALVAATVAALIVWVIGIRITRFALPVMLVSCALAAPMIQELLAQSRRVLIVLCFAGVLLNSVYCLIEPVYRDVLRIRRHDWSRAAYYGYPPFIDRLPPGTRILDRTRRSWDFMLAGISLTNSVRSEGGLASADLVIKTGPPDSEDAVLQAEGARLIYNDTPRTLYVKIAAPWRVYQVGSKTTVSLAR